MQFLNAAFLWAGFAVLIPPIIHLFNFRRYKTVFFSDVRFLQNLQNITRQRSTLRQIILMILRMLAIGALVLAFAEPVVLKGGASVSSSRKSAPPIIYIDNSFSMQAGAISGLNLETAKSRVIEIVDAFPRGTDFLFVTNDFDQRHNHLVRADGIRLFLQDLQLSPRVPTIAQVVERSVRNLGFQDVPADAERSIFVISDFQKNICDFSQMEADSLLCINLVPVQGDASPNVSLDSVEFKTPFRMNGMEEELVLSITNHSNAPARNVPVRLQVNGSIKSQQAVDLAPYERKQLNIKYMNTSRGSVRGVAEITDFPIDFDNTINFAYRIDSVRNVLIISDQPADSKYLRALVGRDPNFAITELSPMGLDDVDISDYQTVVVNQLRNVPSQLSNKVQTYVARGGNAVLIPSFDGDISQYNYLLSSVESNGMVSRDTIKCKVLKVNQQSQLLRNAVRQVPDNADLPEITRYFNSMSNSYQGEEVVLETDTYKKVVCTNSYRAGRMHVFYVPLDAQSGKLATHRLIVPILYNAVSMSSNFGQQYYSVIGRDNGFSIKMNGNPDFSQFVIKPENAENEYIPRVSGPDAYMNYKIFSDNCVEKSGFAHLLYVNKMVETIAYNYDRMESDMEFMSAGQVSDMLGEYGFSNVNVVETVGESLNPQEVANASTQHLWKFFIIMAIIFLVTEIFVARFV